jgi:hypothetical protein
VTRRVRAAALAVAVLAAGCTSNETPTSGGSCVPLTGQYSATFHDTCGFSTTVDVTLFQSGCRAVADVPGVGTITGTVQGARLVFAIGFTACGGSASGTLDVTNDGGLSGSYDGSATGGGVCCGTVSGTVVMVRK